MKQGMQAGMDNPIALPTALDDIPLPKILPPVVVIAFTRPDLLNQVLSALQQQTLRPPQIFAFVDGARESNDVPLIEQCISMLQRLEKSIPVRIVTRNKNLGCDQNVSLGLAEVFSQHDSLVYLEDDTVPNRHFYDRMCRLLEAYRDHKKVFSVGSYASFPEIIYSRLTADIEASARVFPWGLGLWADRWRDIASIYQERHHNPFGSFHKIPATIQTKLTMVNQFWLEKEDKRDWTITMTLAALHKKQVHMVPKESFVKNIGFGHPRAKTYRKGQEPAWVNPHYTESAYPNLLPKTLALHEILNTRVSGGELAVHLSRQKGLWLSPLVTWELLQEYPGVWAHFQLLGLFLLRLPTLIRRLCLGYTI